MAAKNPMSKSRKPGDPYITTIDPRTGWTYEVLKTWQQDGSKPYARAFCYVHGFGDDLGDTYVTKIGRVIVDFDATVFASAIDAGEALWGPGSASYGAFLIHLGPSADPANV